MPVDPAGSPALRVQHVSVSFAGAPVLDDISLQLAPGEVLGLLGRNGAGKTTLLNVIATGVQPQHGSVEIGGVEIVATGDAAATSASRSPRTLLERARARWRAGRYRPSSAALAGVARTFQEPRLFSGLTVLDNVLLGQDWRATYSPVSALLSLARMRSQEAEGLRRAWAALRWCDLDAYAASPAAVLDLDQSRRCELARAIAAQPVVLLLDEPSSGLSRVEAERMGTIILRASHEQRCAVLLVEHNEELIEHVCSRTASLVDGRIEKSVTPVGHAGAAGPEHGGAPAAAVR